MVRLGRYLWWQLPMGLVVQRLLVVRRWRLVVMGHRRGRMWDGRLHKESLPRYDTMRHNQRDLPAIGSAVPPCAHKQSSVEVCVVWRDRGCRLTL